MKISIYKIMDFQELPRTIWMLWFQGFDTAPNVIKKCAASWKKHNPTWNIITLDENRIPDYLDVHKITGKNHGYTTKQALSDIIRINLLNQYGGVWVDSTCFCCKPLDDWLGSYFQNGFFAFDRPHIDRAISSWFLASCKDCELTSIFCKAVNSYWSKCSFANQDSRLADLISNRIEKIFFCTSYKSLKFRLLFKTTKLLRMYPYFWFHYLFATTITQNIQGQKQWESIPKYSADIPHRLHHYGLLKPLTKEIKSVIDNKKDPLYKLQWNYNEIDYNNECTLHYLLEQ